MHRIKLIEVFQFYKKDFSNIACLVGDNYSTNIGIARDTNLFFIGRANNWLNLNVKRVLRSYKGHLCKIQNFMVFLQSLKPHAKLCTLSLLPVGLSNATRRSCIWDMIHRYIHVLSSLAEIILASLQRLPSENYAVHALFEEKDNLDALTKFCQNESVKMREVLEFLDNTIQ